MKGRLKQEMHKQLLKTEGFELAPDRLISSAVAAQFFGHAGLPAATDSLAYEPVQRILAIATSDGRVKFVGQDGAECTACSASQSATRCLQFLPKKAALLRVTKDGDLQLWSLSDGHLLESMPFADPVTSIAVMHDEPFILLGCASGNLQVVSMLDNSGNVAVGAAPVHSLELQPFQVEAADMKGQGAVTCLTTRSHAGRHRMLVLHQDTGVTVWDLRYECAVVLARNETAEELASLAGAKATCACWIGGQGICFALGYSTGDICVWGLPGPLQQGVPMNQPIEAVLLGTMRVTPEGETAEAIEQLTFIPGSATDCPNNLLVLGGQVTDMPPALTILPLECLSSDGTNQAQTCPRFQPHSIPWFGAVQGWALVPPEASINEFDDPCAIMVLTEGGQLMVHDLATFQPVPLSLPLQELQAITHCCMCASATQAAPGGGLQAAAKLHSVTLERLRAVTLHLPGMTSAAGTASRWRWVFSGGSRPPPALCPPGSSDLFFTGHEDGRVRVWDATGSVPGLLATVPFDSGGPGVRLRPVSCFQVDVVAGVLVVGHKQGEARVYQFSGQEQQVSCVDLEGKGPGQHHARRQPAGFQCILQCSHHAASISGIAIACGLRLVALADEAGVVSMLELTQPSITFEQQLAQQAICNLQFSQLVVPPSADSKSANKRPSPTKAAQATDEPLSTRPALFMCQADGSVASLEVSGSSLAGQVHWVQPKHRSQVVAMVLLAADGAPLYPQQTHLQLPWPHNNMTMPLLAAASPSEPSGGIPALPGNVGHPASPGGQLVAERHSPTNDGADDAMSNKSATGAYSVYSQSESDDDDYLAAAVAAADAKQGKAKKVKHRHLKALRSKLGSISRGKDKEGSGSISGASPTSEQGLSSRGEGPYPNTPSSPPELHRNPFSTKLGPGFPATTGASQELPSSPSEAHPGPLDPAPPPESQVQPHQAGVVRGVSEPDDEEEVEEQAAAAHVLICCDTSLRLYPAEGIRIGDRSSVKKINLQEALGFAAAFHGPDGPGLLAITRTADAALWTLPGLEPVKVFSLSCCLGFPWSWQSEASLLTNLHHMCCLAPDGHMALVAPCNEVVTLGVLRGLHPPTPLKGLYDRDLSEAAIAAAGAIADLQEKREPWSGVTPHDATASTEDGGSAESPSAAGRGGARGGHFGTFLSQVKDAASKVVEEGGAGVAKTLALGKRLPFGGAAAVHVSRPPPPTLHQLFAQAAPQAESSGEIDSITDDEETNAAAADVQSRQGGSPGRQSWGTRPQDSTNRSPQKAFASLSGAVGSMFQGQAGGGSSTVESHEPGSARAELLQGASQPESRGKGGMRSAAEIRSAYGRSGTRERDTRSMMADNVMALEERGEKLRNLQDKTSDLNDGAADFASVAKALKEQAASRKWWQL